MVELDKADQMPGFSLNPPHMDVRAVAGDLHIRLLQRDLHVRLVQGTCINNWQGR